MVLGKEEHELHGRRKNRNLWVGGILGGFVLLVFVVTIVKLSTGQVFEAYDHVVRPSITVDE